MSYDSTTSSTSMPPPQVDSPEASFLLPHSGATSRDEGVDLLAILAVFLTQWRIVVVTAAVVFLIAVAYVFTLKSQFIATAAILPEVERNANDSLAALFSPRSPGGVFVGLLQSRTVANDVIDRTHLLDVYHTDSYERARDVLSGQATFRVGADSIVVISVRDSNAKQASEIANAYLGALSDLNISMSKNQSHELQKFFEQQLEQEKAELYKAEDHMEQTETRSGIVQPDAQVSIGLNAIAGVRSQIVNLQVQLAAALQSETNENPQVQNLRSQIAQLQAQESLMENGSRSPTGAAPPADQIPKNNLDYLRAARDVKYYEAIVSSLSTQYEGAAFQIVDQSTVPEHKAWPPRKLFVEVSLAAAILAGIFVAMGRLVLMRILGDPANEKSLDMIRATFRLG
jgi:tyrosine-protein kinase Etk/Wzc